MKNFLAGLLAVVMSFFPGTSEVVTIPADGDYDVMPLADVSDFKFISLSNVSFAYVYLSRYEDESGNFIVPISSIYGSSSYSSPDEICNFFSFFSDSYYIVGYFSYKSGYASRLSLYGIPKSNFQFSSFTVSSCLNKSSSHIHYGFVGLSGDESDFLCSSYSFNGSYFHVYSIPTSPSSCYYTIYCPSSSTNQAAFFSDDFLFSEIPSDLVSYFSKQRYVTDFSCIKFKFYDSEEIFDIFSSASSTHTLTVNYLYSEDNPAADPITQELSSGEEYSISSPEIEGYTPSIPLVTGTMPDEDLTIDVYYTKAFYPLTVKYQYQDGSKAAEDVTFQYPMGFTYDIPSPEIEGYIADKPTVSGTMLGNPLEEVVTYSSISYILSVSYQYEDGTQAADTYQDHLVVGASYSITSPTITGYKPDKEIISGTMPAKDTYFTVTYKPDSSGGSSGGGSFGGGDHEGDGDGDGDNDDGDEGGGDSGGGSSGGGWSGNDPFIPSQPPFSGYDPFDMSGGLPDWLYCPFHIRELPSYTYDPFVMPGG